MQVRVQCATHIKCGCNTRCCCQVSADEAAARIAAAGEPYKAEILESIRQRDPSAAITIYHIGETDHPDHW